jgi:hypothetical protein
VGVVVQGMDGGLAEMLPHNIWCLLCYAQRNGNGRQKEG